MFQIHIFIMYFTLQSNKEPVCTHPENYNLIIMWWLFLSNFWKSANQKIGNKIQSYEIKSNYKNYHYSNKF